MSGWRRGLHIAFDRQPAVMLLALLCLFFNAVALIAVLFILFSPTAH